MGCFSDETPSGTILTPISSKSITARQQVAMELLQTEKNYVGILTTILKVRQFNRSPNN